MKKNIFTFLFLFILVAASFAQNKGEVIMLNKADFLSKVYNYEKNTDKWIFEGSRPCIIDFYADWCGPCKKVAPVLSELAKEYESQIDIYKIDTDKERELARFFGISSIPTILFVDLEGDPQIARGALSKEDFTKAINNIFSINKW
ncbi:hypothetical protein AwDysgo_07970 [Bacteroidales bacterium]|nr:hypothetical protein AwDysgo_07970 [Bacteroidales bacterium]